MKTVLAAAFAMLVPTSVQASGPEWVTGGPAQMAPPIQEDQALTRIYITPPVRGAVYVYDGRALLGYLRRPGMIAVDGGRSYWVAATRGGATVWTRYVSAISPWMELDWSQPGRSFAARPYEPRIIDGPRLGEPAPPSGADRPVEIRRYRR